MAIIGSGAGAGITAELLSKAGLRIAIVEEGPLKSSSDFRQLESDAYPTLYQEASGRKTADKAIAVLQGRCVGGTTTVNWTSSFRTPDATLTHWGAQFGLSDLSPKAMAPYFEQAEARLSVTPWPTPPNENNELLRRGATKLGISAAVIPRNVKGCYNLGSCGMGCPTNAKQSMLVTTLPVALDAGAQLLVETRAERLEFSGDRVTALHCTAVLPNGAVAEGAARCVIRARHFVLAAGAIGSPAVLLRSKAPDPHERLGQRTFLHPVVLTTGTYAQRINGWDGAPQSIYSDHFLETQPIDGPIGYKLEAPPMYPVISSTIIGGYGKPYGETLAKFPHTAAVLALLRDGFHEQSPGGRVRLRKDGSPELDYTLTPFVLDGARRALLTMAEIQFASGAERVFASHEAAADGYANWAEARQAIAALEMKPHLLSVFSAHVMGGCGMAADANKGVTRPDGQHWQLANLSVHDGSLFPTSIGANPQLSIYGLVNRLAQQLVVRLGGKAQALA